MQLMARYIYFVLVFCLTLSLQNGVYAKRDLVQRRQERLAKAEAPWSEPKVTINVHYRLPIYDALGFLAANYDDTTQFNELLTQVRPLANKVKDLTAGSLQGRSFPESLDKQLRADLQTLFAHVEDIYGANALHELKDYLEQKQAATNTGLLGLIE